MKVEKTTNEKGKEDLHIIISVNDGELFQTAVLQFAEKVSNTKAHTSKMRRLAMLIDKKL